MNPGPWVKATKGEVWPIPYDKHTTQKYFIVRPSKFTFKVSGDDGCTVYDVFVVLFALGQW